MVQVSPGRLIGVKARPSGAPPSSAMSKPELITTVHADFNALPPACAGLFALAGGDVFSTLPWYENFSRGVTSMSGALRIYAVTDAAGQARLVMPMWQQAQVGVLAGRTLQPVANHYTGLYSPLTHPEGDEAEALGAWACALMAELPRWQRINLFPMATETTNFEALQVALRRAGFRTQPYFCFANWYLKVAGRSYEEYFDSLPSKLRHTVIRKSRQLGAMQGFHIAILTEPWQSAEGARVFDRVYGASWKNPEAYPAFIPGLIQTCATQGWLRMGVAYLNGVAVAFQIWIVHGEVASIYKLAYDEAHAKLSIGSVLTATMMHHVIDHDKVSEVDYLSGDEEYKRDWMSDRRERCGIAAFNPRTLRGALSGARNLLGRRLKALLPKAKRD
jgi:CelD/BcsL family acetyltransferase involved in cellulose biosynthesis